MKSLFILAFLFIAPIASADSFLIVYKQDLILKSEALSHRDLIDLWKEQTQKAASGVLPASLRSQDLWILGASIVDLNTESALGLLRDARVEKTVRLGRRAHLTSLLERLTTRPPTYGLEILGLPRIWQSYPQLDGKGVRVGIIDTGIDDRHPDLRGKTVAFRDYIADRKNPYDDYGHGSFVAGVIGGGEASDYQIGVAPQASLVVAKAFSQYGGSEDKNLLLALQWMADPDGDSKTADGVRVISNSWNVDSPIASLDPDSEPFCRVLERLKSLGIVSVFSAGNDGPKDGTILVPGACPAALTVGASDRRDQVIEMSSHGPIFWKTQRTLKPDLVAPGADVYSAWRDGDYVYKTGTSMATPFAAGALALLLQYRPGLNPDQMKILLTKSARKTGRADFNSGYGYGVLSAWGALEQARLNRESGLDSSGRSPRH